MHPVAMRVPVWGGQVNSVCSKGTAWAQREGSGAVERPVGSWRNAGEVVAEGGRQGQIEKGLVRHRELSGYDFVDEKIK